MSSPQRKAPRPSELGREVLRVGLNTMDLLPTLLEMAGLSAPNSLSETGAAGRDGVSLVPLLRQFGELCRTELFWHYPHHQHYQLGGAMPYGTIRSGDFKFIEFSNDRHMELYNVRVDIGEQRDLAATMPKKIEELRTRLHEWRQEVGAQMPTPNPQYDPTKPEYDPPPSNAKKKVLK